MRSDDRKHFGGRSPQRRERGDSTHPSSTPPTRGQAEVILGPLPGKYSLGTGWGRGGGPEVASSVCLGHFLIRPGRQRRQRVRSGAELSIQPA